MAKLVELNDIKDPNYIVVGQVLTISTTDSPPPAKPANTTSKATIEVFGLQSNTDRSMYVRWKWDKTNTENYKIRWWYDTGDGVALLGTETTTTFTHSTYTAPENARKVWFHVLPISYKHKVNGKDTAYWTAQWSTQVSYYFSNNPPSVPPVPTVTIEDYTLTAELDNLDLNATEIKFQVVKDDESYFGSATKIKIDKTYAAYSRKVDAGSRYKVRCQAWRDDQCSDWSAYSANVDTITAVPEGITTIQAKSETSVYLEWTAVANADSYDLEYTTKKEYFDGSDQTSTATGIEFNHYEKTGLESGEEYFFRVRAVNEKGPSGWSGIKSIVIGKNPVAPTTWSSTTTATVGDPLTLYWVHNAEDGSSETSAELEIYVNGVKETHIIENTATGDDKDKTKSYSVNTSGYVEGGKIQWRVRTAGITKQYGEWSVQRTIDIYAPPTITMEITDVNGSDIGTLMSFPFYVKATAGPKTQSPIGYHLTVTSNESYEAIDQIGNVKVIRVDDILYSKNFDISNNLLVELSANNIDLENNVSYTVRCSVTMNSGLTAETSSELRVSWTDNKYEPNAEIAIDKDTFVAYIRPYCEDENGAIINDIMLSVYRREFDGSFVEIMKYIDNSKNVYITDPHPALDYARYRIVAITKSTGSVSYYDVPGYPVGVSSVIIQWDDRWTVFDTNSEDVLAEPPWSGSLLELKYNIDVSDNNNKDVSLVEYIGRKHPVSYYGTQLGEAAVWNVDIVKEDKETLYALRRLKIWNGDVYVREPSGSGYWANISVSFSQKHTVLTIPVTLDIKRVEGGI